LRLFTISTEDKLRPYKEFDFKESNYESDLETLLEANPEYFFDYSRIMMIGRQVTTNLTSYIDLLGIDKNGDTVVVELKRDKTPRDTIAQLLEYASYVENLDYEQLNEIFQEYSGEQVDLEAYHKEYFEAEPNEKVAFNKKQKLLVIAQEISKEVKQTANFLRKSGIDLYCLEFKYFKTQSDEKIISSDFVVGDEDYKKQPVQSTALPKVDERQFLEALDENGRLVFNKLLIFAKSHNLPLVWGSKGFSLNVPKNGDRIPILFGYPPQSVFKQSVYTGLEYISKKIASSQDIVDFFKKQLESTGNFVRGGANIKWVIGKSYSEEQVNTFLNILNDVVEKIKQRVSEE